MYLHSTVKIHTYTPPAQATRVIPYNSSTACQWSTSPKPGLHFYKQRLFDPCLWSWSVKVMILSITHQTNRQTEKYYFNLWECIWCFHSLCSHLQWYCKACGHGVHTENTLWDLQLYHTPLNSKKIFTGSFWHITEQKHPSLTWIGFDLLTHFNLCILWGVCVHTGICNI